jgi:hypothetical protein
VPETVTPPSSRDERLRRVVDRGTRLRFWTRMRWGAVVTGVIAVVSVAALTALPGKRVVHTAGPLASAPAQSVTSSERPSPQLTDAPTATPVASPSPEPTPPRSAALLVGRRFLSVSVSEDGKPRELVHNNRISLSFSEREDTEPDRGEVRGRFSLGFFAGCNHWGLDTDITSNQIRLVGRIEHTLNGCPNDSDAQDDWLRSFFESDPAWNLADGHLTLSTQRTVIEFEPDGPS